MLKIESKENSDSGLWLEIKSGREDAFDLLFKKYYVELVMYCRNTIHVNQEFAEDCVQDIFADLWKYRNNISSNIIVRSYLFTSVRNRIYKNKKKFKLSLSFKRDDNFHFDSFFQNEFLGLSDEDLLRREKLNKIINELSERQREIIYLCYINNLTISQASVILKINYQSAKNPIFRTLTVIRGKISAFILILLFL